jgi:hypothetical protein
MEGSEKRIGRKLKEAQAQKGCPIKDTQEA